MGEWTAKVTQCPKERHQWPHQMDLIKKFNNGSWIIKANGGQI